MSTIEEVLAGTAKFAVVCGDATAVLKSLPDNAAHVCYCDPPYGLSAQDTGDVLACLTAWLAGNVYTHHGPGFMGNDWDAFVPGPEAWREVYRVLKPGAYCVAFSSTRTVDLLGIAMRLGGLEPRNGWAWVYGSGFPKNLDVSKAIDKMSGAERNVIGVKPGHEDFVHRADPHSAGGRSDGWDRPWREDAEKVRASHMATAPATDAAKQWDGYGTDVKPSYEPLVVTRKPLDGTVASNVLTHGCGALNIDGARVGFDSESDKASAFPRGRLTSRSLAGPGGSQDAQRNGFEAKQSSLGRFPANLALVHDEECVRVGTVKVKSSDRCGHSDRDSPAGILFGTGNGGKKSMHSEIRHGDADGTETVDDWRCTETCAVRFLGEQSGELHARGNVTPTKNGTTGFVGGGIKTGGLYTRDTGTAARFFYQGKASANDRLAYLTCSPTCTENDTVAPVKNVTGKVCPVCNHTRTDYQHPTVKPYELALYHAKLLSLPPHTSPVAIVPFCGTGVEARALLDVGYRVIAVDIDPRHVAMTRYRLSGEQPVREAPVQETTEAPETAAPITLDDLFGF